MAVKAREVVRVVTLAVALAAPFVQARELADDDRVFVTTAEAACAAEVGLAGVALQRTVNDAIKHLAQTITDDCRKAGFELQALTEIDPKSVVLTPAQSSARSKLEAVDQPHFDRRYLATVVDDHQAMVQIFTKASQSISQPRLKEFAVVTLAHLQAHLDEARRLQQPPKPRPA